MAEDPRKLLELIYARNELESKRSLYQYLNRVVIDCRPQPAVFESVIEPWQKSRNDRLVPALEFVAGIRKEYQGPLNFYEGFGKGHDKSSYLARVLNYLLGFAPKKGLRLCCAAKDAEQAGVIRDCMLREAQLNPWIGKHLDFKQKNVQGTSNGSILQVLTSDAAGVQGSSPDVTVCDEISHWTNRDMFDALFNGAKKKQGYAAFVVLTNAGMLGTWQHGVKNIAEEYAGSLWSYFNQPEGRPMASWITPAALTEAKLITHPIEYRRLFLNEWVNLNEDRGVFRIEDVDAAIGVPLDPPKEATVVLGVDYGLTNDPTALCTCWFDGTKVHVPELLRWKGTPESPIKAEKVEQWVVQRLRKYRKCVVVFDKYQLEPVIQRLEDQGHNVKRFEYRGGKQLFTLAENLRTLLQNRKLVFAADAGYFNGETFADELKQVIYRPMAYGYRIDHKATEHDDLTAAVGMAALEVVKHPPVAQMSLGQSSPKTSAPRSHTNPYFSQDHISRRGLWGC